MPTLEELFSDYPTLLDDPDRVVLRLRMDQPVLIRGEAPLALDTIEAILETDASYFPQTSVEGTAWRLIRSQRKYRMQRRARRYGKGPNVAEMRAIILGMKDANRKSVRTLLIRTDSSWAANVLAGLWTARQPHTLSVAEEALSLLEEFEAVALVHTRTKNIAPVDRAARLAAEKKRKEVEEMIAKRIEAVRQVMERAGDVHLRWAGDRWIAENRFNVNVDPPSCSCPGWNLRWKNIPLPGKRANRNPCRHIAAAAMEEGIRDPGDLLQLMRKARA